MINIMRKIIIPLYGISILMFIINCTPGKSLIRRDENKINHETINEDVYDVEYNKFSNEEDRIEKRVKSRSGNQSANSDYDENLVFDVSDEATDNRNNSYKQERYYQTGMASWYGREFHGKVTASGEKFNMNEFSAAHKTLPFGTIVKVKNFDNGRSARVRINDRGPYRGNRIIDLSYITAKRLGIISSGKAMVGITILKKGTGREVYRGYGSRKNSSVEPVVDDNFEDDSGLNDRSLGNYSLQTGAFYSKRNAENLKKKIETLIENPVIVIYDGNMYKVRIKGISSRKEAKRCKRMLAEEDIASFVVNNIE